MVFLGQGQKFAGGVFVVSIDVGRDPAPVIGLKGQIKTIRPHADGQKNNPAAKYKIL